MEIKYGGTFINFGCYDGITNDPIYEYINTYNLNGYFVDANIDKLITCSESFKGRKFVFEGLGINTTSGDHNFYEPKKIEKVPEWFYQTGTFDFNKVKEICGKLNLSLDSYTSKSISCETIDEFIIKRGITELEIVNLDLEGMDSSVIRQFPFHIVKPKIIIIEIIDDFGINESTFNYICSKGYTSDRSPITDWSLKFTLRE